MAIKQLLANNIVTAAFLVSVMVTPTFSYDPTNVPRFLMLQVVGLVSFAVLATNAKSVYQSGYKFVFVSFLIFIVWLSIALLNSKSNVTEGLFGVTGRQTGFLTYLSLASVLLISAVVVTEEMLKRSVKYLILAGWLTGIYGLLQMLNLDFFDWINPYSPVFGLFGNPNFHSSFMGISAVACLALLFNRKLSRHGAFSYICFSIIALLNIYGSKSLQGFLVYFFGCLVVLFLNIWKSQKFRRYGNGAVLLVALIVTIMVLDILQKLPWNSVLYKESVSFRGDFWRAGWKMTLAEPIFGVGPDGYRDQYRLFRDSVATSRPEFEISVDSAHNVFLDISSSGGFPLLFIYLFFVSLTLRAIFLLIRRNDTLSPTVIALTACWLAYISQSIISINQIGIAIWGWLISGLLIGYEILTRSQSVKLPKLSSGWSLPISVVAGGLIAAFLGLSLLVSDATFRSTVKSGDVLSIQAAAEKWPRSVTRMVLISEIFRGAGFTEQSELIARKAVAFNPINYEAWKELSLQPNLSESEREFIRSKLRELDPLNPTLQ